MNDCGRAGGYGFIVEADLRAPDKTADGYASIIILP